jgi:hypothetical protein
VWNETDANGANETNAKGGSAGIGGMGGIEYSNGMSGYEEWRY